MSRYDRTAVGSEIIAALVGSPQHTAVRSRKVPYTSPKLASQPTSTAKPI
jgi:hypothetical protein